MVGWMDGVCVREREKGRRGEIFNALGGMNERAVL